MAGVVSGASGGFVYQQVPTNSPTVEEKSSRKEGKLAFDVTLQNVNEDESIRQDDDQTRILGVEDQIDWTETLCEERELLDADCRHLIKCTIEKLTDRDRRALTVADRNKLVSKAETMWSRAMQIPESCKAALEQEKAALLCDLEQRTALSRQQYAKAAGSSLNSLAQQWTGHDEKEVTAALMGIAAKYHWEGVRFQSEALNSAFDAADTVYHQFSNSLMSRAVNLLGILRGALDVNKREQEHDEQRTRDEDEDIARDSVTNRDMDRLTTDFQTHWHRMAIDSDAAGTYTSDVDDIVAKQPSIL